MEQHFLDVLGVYSAGLLCQKGITAQTSCHISYFSMYLSSRQLESTSFYYFVCFRWLLPKGNLV